MYYEQYFENNFILTVIIKFCSYADFILINSNKRTEIIILILHVILFVTVLQ